MTDDSEAGVRLTDAQLHTLRHMLGINNPDDRAPKPYRDHYCANPGDPYLRALAEAGMVELVSGPLPHLPYDNYRCTPAGRAAAMASHKLIRNTKGSRVYSKYLDVHECCPDLTFKQFLTDPQFAEARRNA